MADPSSSITDELRQRQRVGERGLLDKFSSRVGVVERARPWLAIVAVLGALTAAVARAITGDLGLGLTIAGAVLAAVGGALVALMDYRKLELGREAASAIALADEAIAHAAALEARVGYIEQTASNLDLRRVHRLNALRFMNGTIEQCLAKDVGTDDAADTMLGVAGVDIAGAIGFDAGEYWTVSVFTLDASSDDLVRIAALWADRAGERGDGRSWRKGEGYTGVAWRREEEVIEEDTLAPGKADEYRVPASKHRIYDAERYRSVASIPIRIAPDQAIWGVVTATSNRVGRFQRNAARTEFQAVEMVRDVAGTMALLAVAERYAPEESDG